MKPNLHTLVFLFAINLCHFQYANAQAITSLPKAAEVTNGVLPNGISYYLVENKSFKGFADFAVIQKDNEDDASCRSLLSTSFHFQNDKPYQFLAKLGCGYKKSGYIVSEERSRRFIFEDIPVVKDVVRDTVLLYLLDIAGECRNGQAIVVCGDIDSKKMLERMQILSLTVSPRTGKEAVREYEWNSGTGPSVSVQDTDCAGTALLKFSYRMERTPESLMNTIQPLVSRMFANIFEIMLKDRVERVMRLNGLPVAMIHTEYTESSRTFGDESLSLSIRVKESDAEKAAGIVASVFSALDRDGVESGEFRIARAKLENLMDSASGQITNREWVEKCASAFLHGSDLASPSALKEFFEKKTLGEKRELELFNEFVFALLDPEQALDIDVKSSGGSVNRYAAAFAEGWKKRTTTIDPVTETFDTLKLTNPKKKVKLNETKPEKISGGQMMSFANGMDVLCIDNSSDKGRLTFGFLLKGGFTGIPGLRQGEGGFYTDMFALCRIAGQSWKSFVNMLEYNGISIKTEVREDDCLISGRAPASKIDLLLQSLAAIASRRSLDVDAFDYYSRCQRIELACKQDVTHLMDSLMCPEYIYGTDKYASALENDIPEKAEEYFDGVFSKCNDALLVLDGDFDQFELKKTLQKQLGSFPASGKKSVRPALSYNLRKGWSTYTVQAESVEERCVALALESDGPVNSERYFSFLAAMKVIEKKMTEALCETGYYAGVEGSVSLLPSEKLSVHIVCRPAEEKGLPDGMKPADALSVLGAVRIALSQLTEDGPDEESISLYKNALTSEYEILGRDTGFNLEACLKRFATGKDLVSAYKDSIAKTNAASVKSVLEALDKGGKIEYVIY